MLQVKLDLFLEIYIERPGRFVVWLRPIDLENLTNSTNSFWSFVRIGEAKERKRVFGSRVLAETDHSLFFLYALWSRHASIDWNHLRRRRLALIARRKGRKKKTTRLLVAATSSRGWDVKTRANCVTQWGLFLLVAPWVQLNAAD
jgi:hypothetical protein